MPSYERPPAFLLNPRIFLSDSKVALMSTRAIGAYLLILFHSYESEPGLVPDDDKVLARWGRLTAEEWAEEGACVRNAFALHPHRVGMLLQKRMALEYELFLENNRKKSEAGKAAADKRWRKHRKNQRLTPDANALPTQCDGNANPYANAMPKNANNKYNSSSPPLRARAGKVPDTTPSDKSEANGQPGVEKNGQPIPESLQSHPHAPTLDQVLALAAKENWPYSREVMLKAFQSFEATKLNGLWQFGRHPARDWRAAFHVRCGDYESNKTRTAAPARGGRRPIEKADYEKDRTEA